jgi:hypothetical protein
MRTWIAVACLVCASSALFAPTAWAQDDLPTAGNVDDPDGYVALSADDLAQQSLGGFRRYLERIRPSDAVLYAELDPPTAALERRDTAADIVFWTATGLSVAALVTAIPVYTELGATGNDVAIGLLVGGLTTFALGVLIQAFIRPGHSDLVALIDRHDELLGRR